MRRALLVVLLAVILGGVIFLMTWDIPPPVREVEIAIPDAELPR